MGDLAVYFVPMTYRQINEVGRVQYEDQKIMQMVNSSELSEEEKMTKLGEAFKRITQLTVRSIAASINAIKSDDVMVTDSQQIEEFLLNVDKAVFETIKQKVLQLREATDLKPISMRCNSCSHEYQQSFTLDMSNFFETAS
jgi:bacterioferritin-associated ferredoxin